jgi:hypothetical protein
VNRCRTVVGGALTGAAQWRAVRWWAPVIAGLALTVLFLSITARLTVLDARYDQRAVARSNAYERLYTEVLPTPAAQRVLREALAPLPISPSFVLANNRLLLPPDVLSETVNKALAQFVAYVLGGRDGLDVPLILSPVVAHTTEISQHLLPGLVTSAPHVTDSSLQRFDLDFASFIAGLRSGKLPSIPRFPLSRTTADRVATTLTSGLDAEQRTKVDGQLRLLLSSGRLDEAIALVAPAYAAQYPGLQDELTDGLSATVSTVQHPLTELRSYGTVRSLRTVHSVVPLGLWSFPLLGSLVALAALALAAHAAGRSEESLIAAIAGQLGGAALVASGVGLLVLATLPDPLRALANGGDLPASLSAIVTDIDHHLRGGVVTTYLHLCGGLLLGAGAIALVYVIATYGVSIRHLLRTALVVGAAAATTTVVTTAIPNGTPPATCNGYASLCHKPYDDVAFLATHNSMSSSDAGFINAEQDPTIIGQLNSGARALLVDFHYWTTGTAVQRFLHRLPPSSRDALAPLMTDIGTKPGVWLCHVACQLGATPATSGLHAVAEWLRTHHDAVLTLIVEDHTSPADTLSTLEKAGLKRFAWVQSAPGAPWPTLGEMVRSGHRLVVFTERADALAPWVSNYHQVGAETAFRASSPSDLSCAPGRGPAFARLFLLNNWISTDAPSRSEAAQVNAYGALSRRAARCRHERHMMPNFIAVDFAAIGDPLRVVDRLNHVSR